MPERRESKTDLVVTGFLIVLLGVLVLLIVLNNVLQKYGLTWLIPVLIVVAVGLGIYLKIQADKKRALLEKQAEERRVKNIMVHVNEWGEEMCKWLIIEKYSLGNLRTMNIMQQFDTWGIETCQNLLKQTIAIGMTDEMVRFSLGTPTSIDNKEISSRGEKFRYIYGVPRQGAAYIWFIDGKVTKIKQ